MKPSLHLLKIGGRVIDDAESLQIILQYFSQLPGAKILVHGGGRKADEMLDRMQIERKMVAGRRLTDASTLEVVTMVYAGLLNKQVVAQLQAKNCMALGCCGADANLILAKKRAPGKVDYGFAGDIIAINTTVLHQWLQTGVSPVFCAITHDGQGQLLNTNADTVAAGLAVAMSSTYVVSLQYCFDKPGVLIDPENEASVIATLTSDTYQSLREGAKINAGMIPKLDNAFTCLEQGVATVVLGNVNSLMEQRGTALCAGKTNEQPMQR